MKLPPELASAERHEVHGRQGWKIGQQLRFAEFEVPEVSRGITKGGDLRILSYDQSRRKQLYSFVMFDGEGGEWGGDCESYLRRRRLDLDVSVEFRNRSELGARFVEASTGETWVLRMMEDWESPLKGSLAGAGRELQVRGTRSLQGSPLPLDEATGYVIESQGEVLAAAETISDGAVWFSESLEPSIRGPVASCLAALLLFEELRHTLDE